MHIRLNVALLLKIFKNLLLTSALNFNVGIVFNYVFLSFVNIDICLSTNYHELAQVHKQRANNEANLLNAKEHKLNPMQSSSSDIHVTVSTVS